MYLAKYNNDTANYKDEALVMGELYWIDEESKIMKNYIYFVDVYLDKEKQKKVCSAPDYLFSNVSELIERDETYVQVREKAPYYESYYCPSCGNHVEYDNCFCPSCACRLDWDYIDKVLSSEE